MDLDAEPVQAEVTVGAGADQIEDDEIELTDQNLHRTLDDLAQDDYGSRSTSQCAKITLADLFTGSFFPPNFSHTPNNHPFGNHQPSHSGDPGPSALPDSSSVGLENTDRPAPPALTRKRGRPKGSKNKPKLMQAPRPPKPSPPPKRPKGRPPKARSEEERTDYERRKEEKALGIKRKKGRPRKFSGYLVREMRLKKNRSEFNELLKRQDEERGESDLEAHIGDTGTDVPYQDCSGPDEQSLLDVVAAAQLPLADGQEVEVKEERNFSSGPVFRSVDDGMDEFFARLADVGEMN